MINKTKGFHVKKYGLLALLLLTSTSVFAGGNELGYVRVQELRTLASDAIGTGDFIPVFDASAGKVRKVDATAYPSAGGAFNGTVGATTPRTGAFTSVATSLAVTATRAPMADNAATNNGLSVVFATPVDTTGTNVYNGLIVTPTIGNATGGTNTFTGLNLPNVTGDAQVTERGIFIGTGYDSGMIVNSPAIFNSTLSGDGGDAFTGFLNNTITSTTTTLTAAQCGSTIVNDSADVLSLPEASTVIGCRYTFITNNASNFDVNPDNADLITVLTNAAGDAIRNATIGNSVCLQAVDATNWSQCGIVGTWTDVN